MKPDRDLVAPDNVPVRRMDVKIRRAGDDLYLGMNEYALRLSESAMSIYTSIDGRRTLTQIAAEIANRYEIDEAEAVDDATELLALLTAEGVVSWMAPTGGA